MNISKSQLAIQLTAWIVEITDVAEFHTTYYMYISHYILYVHFSVDNPRKMVCALKPLSPKQCTDVHGKSVLMISFCRKNSTFLFHLVQYWLYSILAQPDRKSFVITSIMLETQALVVFSFNTIVAISIGSQPDTTGSSHDDQPESIWYNYDRINNIYNIHRFATKHNDQLSPQCPARIHFRVHLHASTNSPTFQPTPDWLTARRRNGAATKGRQKHQRSALLCVWEFPVYVVNVVMNISSGFCQPAHLFQNVMIIFQVGIAKSRHRNFPYAV